MNNMNTETFYHVAPLVFLQHTKVKPEHYDAVMTFCREFVEIGTNAKLDANVQEYLYTFIKDTLPTLQGKDYTIADQFAIELIADDCGNLSDWLAICDECKGVYNKDDNKHKSYEVFGDEVTVCGLCADMYN